METTTEKAISICFLFSVMIAITIICTYMAINTEEKSISSKIVGKELRNTGVRHYLILENGDEEHVDATTYYKSDIGDIYYYTAWGMKTHIDRFPFEYFLLTGIPFVIMIVVRSIEKKKEKMERDYYIEHKRW